MSAKKHSRHAPSSAGRWITCPGSIKRIEKLIATGQYEETRTNVFAAEGTAAHQIREDCLRFGFDAYDFEGIKQAADGMVFEVDEEMCDALQEGIDRIREFDGELLVETRVNTTPWVGPDDEGDDQGGTIDAVVICWNIAHIVMSDLKYGTGIPVEAVDNDQCRVYLLALVSWLEAKYGVIFEDWKFTIIIDQPRHGAGGGEWSFTYAELMEFGEKVKKAADLSRKRNAPIKPSIKACMWCPCAKIDGACPEFEKFELSLLGIEPVDLDDFDEELELQDIEVITPKRRSYIIKHLPMITKWLTRLHADAIADFLAGNDVPHYKVIEGGGRRRAHLSEEQSMAFFKKNGLPRSEWYTQKLLSPAQAEKAIGLKNGTFPKKLLKVPEPKPVLVPVEDDRPAMMIQSDYVNLDDDSDDI